MKNLKERTAQNKQHTAKHTATVMIDKAKWRWWWAEKMTETETTTMMIMTAAMTAVMTAANWIKKFSHLNRINKEIRIRTGIKSIYDKTTCLLSTCLIKKEINEQKAATDRFRLQFVYNKFFVVQQTHKMYFMICTHNSSAFTQQSHSSRTVCSAFRTVCAVFFDLIFFFCTYWERSFFFFFFFLIDLKEITIHNISMNLTEQQKSDDDDRTDVTVTARREV